MTLKRRKKKRYISVIHACPTDEAVTALESRLRDLYGTIAFERASLKVVRSSDCVSVFRCVLGSERMVLTTIALTNPPLTTLDMSSSLKRLKRRLLKRLIPLS